MTLPGEEVSLKVVSVFKLVAASDSVVMTSVSGGAREVEPVLCVTWVGELHLSQNRIHSKPR